MSSHAPLASANTCRRFSLAEIQSVTEDFNDRLCIGKGGFGKVYKDQNVSQESGGGVAIKRLDSMSTQGASEFRTEIEMLSKLRHCNLVSLMGYCDDNNEMILVYEYMPNGTLYHHLHKANSPLSWVQRLKIAIGAARGLDYLHTGVGTKHGVIHRDVKSSNILLDENWEAKISDFGLSKIGPINQLISHVSASVKGTFGYLDPEYFLTRRLTRKTDVFAFGVVLFELLSGRLAVDNIREEDECSLVRWAQKCVKNRKVDQMVDSSIKGTIALKCLRGFAQIAHHCLHSVPNKRPTMTEVVASLQALLELQAKYDNSVKSQDGFGFTRKIHKYLVSATAKRNSDQIRGSSLQKILENNTTEFSSTNEDAGYHDELVTQNLKMFTHSELKLVTKNFGGHGCLGKGRYGEVYKGWVDNMTYSPYEDDTGMPVVVRKLGRYIYFDPEILKEFCHPNLVKLIGYCLEGEQIFLVYEFMYGGNLKDLLCSGAVAQLPLVTKVKIVGGIARGIVSLYNSKYDVRRFPVEPGVSKYRLYRHNILLDEEFIAKLSDYDTTVMVHGQYPNNTLLDFDLDINDYFFDCRPYLLQSNLSGFTVVFAEVLTGERISNEKEFREIDRLFWEGGKEYPRFLAKFCFENCSEAGLESKMLTIIDKYKRHVPV